MNTVDRIFKLMAERNITAAQLSKDLDINSSRFTQWKKGLQNPSAEAIAKIAIYFEVSTDYLLCNTDDPTPPNKKEPANQNNFIDISKLSEESRQDLLKQLELLEMRDNAKSKGETVKIFRAARSQDNAEPQRIEVARERLDKIENASDVEEI